MNIKYYAADGTIKSLGDNELAHYKYIKKIKSGSGWRYFYTPEEIRAYYKEAKIETKTKYDREDARAQKTADRRSDAAMNRFENRTNRDIARLKRKAKNGSITEQDLKDFAKKTGKGAADYGKTAAKEQMKSSLIKNKNKIKRVADPITSTGKAVVYKPTSQIKKDSSKKVEKGRSAVEKRLNKAKKTSKGKRWSLTR